MLKKNIKIPKDKPKAILFDWDNTLVDSWEAIYKSLHITFETMGIPPWTIEEVKEKVSLSMRSYFPVIFGDNWNKASQIYLETFKKIHLELITPLENAEKSLKLIKSKNILSYVVSNKSHNLLTEEAENLKWEKYFSKIAGAGYAKNDKPSVDIVNAALEGSNLNLEKDTIWFIGDTISDMECAYNSMSTSVFYGTNYFDQEKHKKYTPNYYVKDHNELINIINNF